MSVSSSTAGEADVGRSCPYCRFSFKGGVSVTECPTCRAVHHSECWEENEGCAVMGCASAPSPNRPTGAAVATPPANMTQPPPPAPVPGQPRAPLATPPSAGEVLGSVKAWLNTPVAAAAGLAGATAAAIVLVVALAVAIITPDTSIIGAGGENLFKETLRVAVGTTMAHFGEGFSYTVLPLLFVAVPMAAAAFGASRESARTAALPVGSRLLAGAACAVPFAVLMFIVSILSTENGLGAKGGSVIVLSLLWGAAGGLIGAARAAGPGSARTLMARVPPTALRYLELSRHAVRPLAILLMLAGLLGVSAWTIQAARGEFSATGVRSTLHAIIENPLYVAEYAVGTASLGMLAKVEVQGEGDGAAIRATPLPFEDHGDFDNFTKGPWRIFAFSGNWSPVTFVLLLILVVGMPLALACYAGYVIATAAGAATPALGAAHGAIVGVVWAFALTLLRWIGNMQMLVGDSVFVGALLTAGAAGAVGGLLAARGVAEAAAGPPPLAEEPAST